MKNILKTTILFALLTLVLLTTVSCKNVLGKLPFFNNESDTTTTPSVTTTPASTTPSDTTTTPAPQEHSHAFGAWVVTKAATCTEKGLQERSCVCDEKETMEIPALGHTEVIDPAVSPTCTTDGLSVGMHCSVCGEVLLAQEVTPAAHVWAQTELVRAATCFVPGEEQRVCRTCGAEETAQIEVLEHNFVQNEETKLYSCTICDARIFAGHLYAAFDGEYHWFDAYQACEDMDGHLVTITSELEQEIITDLMSSALRTKSEYWIGGIRLSDGFHWITEETSEYQNWESGQPNFQGANEFFMGVYSARSTNRYGFWHDYNYNHVCGFIYECRLNIEKCNHTFTEWKTTTEATCWNSGEQWRVCTYCGLEETEVLPQLEHNFAFVEETGMTICEHCGGAKYNGHIYVVFTDETSWFEAYARCEALGGHLATITSEKEQTFVTSYLRSLNCTSYTWLGGYSDGKQCHWITDELFEYTYWAKGEPNNSSGKEWFIHLTSDRDWQWNDISPLEQCIYLCEFECEE